jgi:hypothetical protein
MQQDDAPTKAQIEARLHAELVQLVREATDPRGDKSHYDRIRQILDELEALDGRSSYE